MTINSKAILQQPGQGSSYWVHGDLYTFKAVGKDTGELYALVEALVQPQSGSPPHIHSLEDEACYIQEGEFEFQLDQQTIVATPGTFLHSPKGQLHCFTNIGTKQGKLLFWVTPAGLEKFFAEAGSPVEDPNARPLVTSEDIEKMLTAASKYGVEIIPPNH